MILGLHKFTKPRHEKQAASEGGEAFYYDTDDAYNFYKELWGGEHLHVGIYGEERIPVS